VVARLHCMVKLSQCQAARVRRWIASANSGACEIAKGRAPPKEAGLAGDRREMALKRDCH